ncbi:MAG: NAD-dependent epimerase/dehydratase family protein [Bacteroidetes bacterium]|nr:NAD-dependent epimerase/dehydratase family protein [Bacteroidota bacterium]
MNNVLVTGGAGFIGAHVAEHCLKLGMNVVVLDDLSGGFEDNVPDGCTFVKGSITDHELIDTLFNQYKFKHVYHLAAYAAEGLSHFIRRFNYTNNVIGSLNLINASVNTGTVERFVFTSSIAVYGAGQLPMTESMRPEPEDPYGIAKYAVEMDLAAAHEMFGLNYTIFRPHNVYGEKQNLGDRYRNVIGIFMNQAMKGESMTIFGDGMQTRAFSHVDDVAPLIAKCVDMPETANEIFNIGADKPYTVKELATIVSKVFEVDQKINHLEARNEVVHAYSSHDKVVEFFGEQDFITLEDGIGRMADWAKSKGPRESSIFSGIEILKNLPPSWAGVMKNNS